MPKGVIWEYPGGLRVLYGGTRTGIRLSRPWQQPIPVPTEPGKCAFCSPRREKETIVLGQFGNGWFHLENKFTPLAYHTKVIPPTCWPEEELRILGCEARIKEAFANISHVVERESANHDELWVNAYVGALAGQNIPHLHYHIIAPERFPDGTDPNVMARELAAIRGRERSFLRGLHGSPRVFRCVRGSAGLAAVVESIFRVGQCYIGYFVEIRDEHYEEYIHAPDLGHLASIVFEVVSGYALAFKSEQGLAPDFQLFFKFNKRGGELGFSWGSYLPILNHHGSTESVGAIHSGGPLI